MFNMLRSKWQQSLQRQSKLQEKLEKDQKARVEEGMSLKCKEQKVKTRMQERKVFSWNVYLARTKKFKESPVY